jgi:hypothetical protein
MFKTSLIAATLIAAVAPTLALAATDAPAKFSHKGVEYNYTTVEQGGEKVVRGTAYAGTVPFELHIHKKTVTGTFNNRPVEFDLAEVKALGIDTTN